MDRNRDSRKTSIVGSNGFNRRRHRTSSFRDSPDDDGGLELQESLRLRDRVKKDRDRERERDHRERERERDLKERSSRSRRRRAERLTSNKDDIGGDETSDESIDDDGDEDGKGTTAAGVRPLTPAAGSISNLHHHHHGYTSHFVQQGQNRKAFPPGSSSSKVFRSPPVWKSGDEMIAVAVPRKARSASTKRSHDWISSSINNNNGSAAIEQTRRPESSSPARAVVPMSPSSSNASMRKKLKPNVNGAGGLKFKPPKASPEPSSSNPEELEIEIAEVLYGMMTQSQGPSSKKEDSREVNRSNGDAKSRNLFPITDSATPSNPSLVSLSVVAPKRKRPRQVPESFGRVKLGAADQPLKGDVSCSPNKPAVGNGYENGSNSNGRIESAPAEERRDLEAKIESSSLQEKESSVTGRDESNLKDIQPTTVASSLDTVIQPNSTLSEKEGQKYAKFEIDLMAPPPQARSPPERCDGAGISTPAVGPMIDAAAIDSLKDKENFKAAERGRTAEEEEEAETQKLAENKNRVIDLQLDLEKPDKEVRNKSQQQQQQQQQSIQKQHQLKAELPPLTEKSVPLPMTMASWPGGLAPMGYMAPLQGVVSVDGTTHLQQPLLSQPRPKRCATHCHIARNIQSLQQFMKMAPVWAGAAPGAASFFSPKTCNLNGLLPGSSSDLRSAGNAVDKGVGKEKGNHQMVVTSSGDSMKQQLLIQQAISPVAAGNLLGPAFIFPLNQQPPVRPGGSAKLGSAGSNSDSSMASAMSFAYPSMATNESQYVAILPNNGGYPFPIPNLGAPPPQMMPLFNGSFYSSQMIHPSQMPQLIQSQPSGGPLSSQKQQHMLPRGSQNVGASHKSHQQQPSQQMAGENVYGQNLRPSATNSPLESHLSMSFSGTSGSEAAARHNIFRVPEDGKSSAAVNSSSAGGEDGKQLLFGKAVGVIGQSVSTATTLANSSIAASSGANRSSSRPSNSSSNNNIQAQSKVAVTVNGSSSVGGIAAKFSGFPQNQSPQWKSSPINKTQQQQHSRGSQISFGGGNQKTSSNSPQSQPSSPMMAASPTTSGSKMASKTASVLSNHPHIAKNQLQQHQQQLFFSSAQSQSLLSSTTASTPAGGYYVPRRRPEQQTPGTISSPLVVSVTATNDPAKATVVKGSQGGGIVNAAQSAGTVLPAGFSYLHPAAVQVKPAEQKQSAG